MFYVLDLNTFVFAGDRYKNALKMAIKMHSFF